MNNQLILKTREGLNRPTLATLDQAELIQHTTATLAKVAPATSFLYSCRTQDKSHTKAAKQYGGGSVYRHMLRANTSVNVNSDLLYPQITIIDRTFSGASLKVYVGFYRIICSNGLTVSVGETLSWSIDHRLSSAVQLMELSRSIAAAWSQVIQAQTVLANAAIASINPIQAIDNLSMFSIRQKEQLKQALPTARPEDNVNTVYGLYNFLNEQDRLTARRGSTAYLDRDTNMLATLIEFAAA
jgi:hypothetical protein